MLPFASGAIQGQAVKDFYRLRNGIVVIRLLTEPVGLELETGLHYTQIGYYPDTQKWWLECNSVEGNNKPIEIELIHVDHLDILID